MLSQNQDPTNLNVIAGNLIVFKSKIYYFTVTRLVDLTDANSKAYKLFAQSIILQNDMEALSFIAYKCITITFVLKNLITWHACFYFKKK